MVEKAQNDTEFTGFPDSEDNDNSPPILKQLNINVRDRQNNGKYFFLN